ncbi:MAG: glycosyltransferase family 39 protein [Candidatus Binatia bacterium]|nr:glycosyltransferase family 39 protein [Candidatus Binatia bacterium]
MRIVAGGASDWSDPALLEHLGRAAAALSRAEDPSRIASVGRLLSALLGSFSVLLLWRLLREAVPSKYALFGATVAAVSPLAVIPAHYFAPDVLVLLFGLTAVCCLVRVLEREETAWRIALGVIIGLAVSSHYGGVLLVLLCAATPLVATVPDRRAYMKKMGPVAGIAVLVFAALNASLFLDPQQLLTGPWIQLRRLAGGDHLHVGATANGAIFHLGRNLLPGLTAPVLLIAAAGFVIAMRRRADLPNAARVSFLYGALAYAVAELSPLKPLPGSLRYVLPVLPAVAMGTALAFQALEDRVRPGAFGWLPAAVMVTVLAFPALRSLHIVEGLSDDSRTRADAWIAANAGRTLREPYSSAAPADFATLTSVDLDAARRGGVTHVATSSFVYDTFARGSRLATQNDYVYQRHERYQELFEYPYEEFAPDGPTLGWSNPTVRVLDIREPRPPGRPD